MHRPLFRLLMGILLVGAISVGLRAAPAQAQIVIEPPSTCIATISPVYYQGRAAYWCGDQWYYQNGDAWGVYGTEPAYLHTYRGSHAPARQFYGRGRETGSSNRGRTGAGGHAGGGGGGHGHL
jgi:hypothetical protein